MAQQVGMRGDLGGLREGPDARLACSGRTGVSRSVRNTRSSSTGRGASPGWTQQQPQRRALTLHLLVSARIQWVRQARSVARSPSAVKRSGHRSRVAAT
jgi:hypothetical protein